MRSPGKFPNLFRALAVLAAAGPSASVAADSDLATFCGKLMAPATDMSFKLFDPRWHSQAWEAARTEVLASCKAWTDAKQDRARIADLTAARNRYAKAALGVQDEMVAATIQRLGALRNQKDTSLCFADAAADIASYVTGKRVSAFSTAVRAFYLKTGGKPSTDAQFRKVIDRYNSGNYNHYVIDGLLEGPVCPDDQPKGSLTYTAKDLTLMWRNYMAMQAKPYAAGQAPTRDQLYLAQYLKRFAPSLPTQDFFNHLDVTKPLDVELFEWIGRNCKLRVPKAEAISRGRPAPWGLDPALDRGALPLIGYDASVLQKGLRGHSSLVVGEATIQGQTYYLVRNSWGSSCGGYNANVAKRCKQGHVWLTKKEIETATETVDYLWYDLHLFPGSDR
jgi:hypothetical protein